MVECIWKDLSSLYEPWIMPLSVDQRLETAAWIQQFADSNKTLLPWAPGDIDIANNMIGVFTNSVGLVGSTIPADKCILSHLMDTYCQRFAQPSVKDFILSPVQDQIMTLQWPTFQPSLEDIMHMVAIVDAFLPLCHEFLGKIFTLIPWQTVMSKAEHKTTTTSHVLHLIVKLSSEPQVRQSGHLLKLVDEGLPHDLWKSVAPQVYANVMQWYVMSVDCKGILENVKEVHTLDKTIIRMLRLASNMDYLESSSNLDNAFQKASVFIRCATRLLNSCGSKHRNYLACHEAEVNNAVNNVVEDVSTFVTYGQTKMPRECESLIKGVLNLINSNSILPKCVVDNVKQDWLQGDDSNVFITALLKNSASCVNSEVVLASLLEDGLEAYFFEEEDDDEEEENQKDIEKNKKSTTTWENVLAHLELPQDKTKLTKTLDQAVKDGQILLLYATLKLTRPQCLNIADEQNMLLSTLLDWFRHLQLSEKSEPKLPLLYREYVQLCQRQLACGTSQAVVVKYLLDFIEVLNPLVEESSNWNFLGVLGLASKYKPNPRARFLASSLVFFIHSNLFHGPKINVKR